MDKAGNVQAFFKECHVIHGIKTTFKQQLDFYLQSEDISPPIKEASLGLGGGEVKTLKSNRI